MSGWNVKSRWFDSRWICMPRWKKEGHITLHMSVSRSTCRSPRPCANDNSRRLCPRNFKLGRKIVLISRWFLLIFRSVGHRSRSKIISSPTPCAPLTQKRFSPEDSNLMSRWSLLIFRSVGQRSCPSTTPCATDNSRRLCPRNFKLGR